MCSINRASPQVQHAFRWTQPEGMLDLGTLGGTTSYAVMINAIGQAIGTAMLARDVATDGVLWNVVRAPS